MRHVDVEALRRGFASVVPIPPHYEDRRLDDAAARTLLRCEDAALDALVEDGLQTFAGDDGRAFRRCDLLNVGLYSGSGRTIPEVAESHRVRWVNEAPERWIEPRTWALELEPRCDRCGAGTWEVPPPVPERFGGELHAWDAGWTGERFLVTGRVTVHGAGHALTSARVDAFDELMGALLEDRLRYQYLPAELRSDPEAAAALGAVDCMAASLVLQGRLADAGTEARTRKGLLLGGAAVEHVWTEVRDGDDWRPLDLVLPRLAAGAGAGGPAFVAFARGSASNRLLPWDLSADDDLVRHACADGGTPRTVDVDLRAAAQVERS